MSDHTEEEATHDDAATLPTKWPKSFLRRQGHTTRGQKRALRELWPDFGLDCSYGTTVDLPSSFGRTGPTTLEVGFGMGENIVANALADPARDFVGVEVHKPGIGAVLSAIQEHELENVRLVRHDIIKFLRDHVTTQAFDQVIVFFPEPWPEDKDIKRRLIRPLLLDLLVMRMRPGGSLHVATDVEGYARHALQVLGQDPRWTNQAAVDFVDRPEWRPLTKYEKKGMAEGRSIFDLEFRLDDVP